MSEIATTVDTYLAMWNETDPGRRAELIELAWAENGRYVDPLLEAEGQAALERHGGHGAFQQYPGHRFRRTSGIDAHHNQVRFTWEVAAPDGALTVAGIDVGVVGSDGRLGADRRLLSGTCRRTERARIKAVCGRPPAGPAGDRPIGGRSPPMPAWPASANTRHSRRACPSPG